MIHGRIFLRLIKNALRAIYYRKHGTEDKHMAGKRREQKRRNAEIRRAVDEMRGIRRELYQAENCFDHMTDPNQMEACIYEINALRARLNCAVLDLKHLTQ